MIISNSSEVAALDVESTPAIGGPARLYDKLHACA